MFIRLLNQSCKTNSSAYKNVPGVVLYHLKFLRLITSDAREELIVSVTDVHKKVFGFLYVMILIA